MTSPAETTGDEGEESLGLVAPGPHRLSTTSDEIAAGAREAAQKLAETVNFTGYVVIIDVANVIQTRVGEEPLTDRRNREANEGRWKAATSTLATHLYETYGDGQQEQDFFKETAWLAFVDEGVPYANFGVKQKVGGQIEDLLGELKEWLPEVVSKNAKVKVAYARQCDLTVLLVASFVLNGGSKPRVVRIVSGDRYADHRILNDSLLHDGALANDRGHYRHIIRPTRRNETEWSFVQAGCGLSGSKPEPSLIPVPDKPGKVLACKNKNCRSLDVSLPGALAQDSDVPGPSSAFVRGNAVHLWACAEHFRPADRRNAADDNSCPYCGGEAEVVDRIHATLMLRPHLEQGETFTGTRLQELAFPLKANEPLTIDTKHLGLGAGTLTFTLTSLGQGESWAGRIGNATWKAVVGGSRYLTLSGAARGATIDKDRRSVTVNEAQLESKAGTPAFRVRGGDDIRPVLVRLLRNR